MDYSPVVRNTWGECVLTASTGQGRDGGSYGFSASGGPAANLTGQELSDGLRTLAGGCETNACGDVQLAVFPTRDPHADVAGALLEFGNDVPSPELPTAPDGA